MQHKPAGRAPATTRRLVATTGALMLAATASLNPASAQETAWSLDGIERVIAISDVHGDFDAMRNTLSSAGVIDAGDAWAAGDTHLVITGDLLDRGPDSRPVMDLVMRLESEAEAAGGALHLLLGNHEVMNLVGDLRYVADEEYAAFAADEDPAERERWYRRFLETEATGEDDAAARGRFAERYPPGFFGHRRAFRSDGTYGAWLLDKPIVVVVNETAFAHGGLSPLVAELGLAGLNDGLMSEVRRYVEALDLLTGAGILDPAENFYRHAEALSALEAESMSEDERAAVAAIQELGASEMHSPDSPLWYRGNVGCPAPVEHDRLGRALDALGARRVVIGHTPTQTRRVLSRLDGRVIEIDTGMLTSYYRGSGQALVIEGDSVRVVSEAGVEVAPFEHPRRVGIRRSDIDSAELERILASGDVSAGEEISRDIRAVKVTSGQVTVDALFIENPRNKGFVPELAAYRLDRFLELDMVPVAVAREVNGDAGVLQFLPAQRLDEAARREAGGGGSAWCPLPEQWEAMYVFDALIYNPGRPMANMMYSRDNYQLMLNGHGDSFGYSRRLPAYLDQVDLAVGNFWLQRLESLDQETVESRFADTLDRRRRRALAGRRDQLIKEARED